MLYQFFVALQIILLCSMMLHDWIDIPPFTDRVAILKKYTYQKVLLGSVLYGIIIGIPLLLTIWYPSIPFWVAVQIVIFYSMTTVGTIFSWWIPYVIGSSDKHKKDFLIFQNTHTFLPARGDNIVPNTLHIMLHIQIWLCCIISWYYLYQSYFF